MMNEFIVVYFRKMLLRVLLFNRVIEKETLAFTSA